MLNRRRFFRYTIGSAATVVGLHWLTTMSAATSPQVAQADMDRFCLRFPLNSRCENYLPGTEAVAPDGAPYSLSGVLNQGGAGDRLPAEGLDDLTYLVILDGPELANYGIRAVCTHFGCTVDWNPTEQAFLCPCHGSRFDGMGQVLDGPANRALGLVTVTTNQDRIGLVDQPPSIDPRLEED